MFREFSNFSRLSQTRQFLAPDLQPDDCVLKIQNGRHEKKERVDIIIFYSSHIWCGGPPVSMRANFIYLFL